MAFENQRKKELNQSVKKEYAIRWRLPMNPNKLAYLHLFLVFPLCFSLLNCIVSMANPHNEPHIRMISHSLDIQPRLMVQFN